MTCSCLKWKQDDALDLAIGNLDPLTGTRIGNFNLTKVRNFDSVSQDCKLTWEENGKEINSLTLFLYKGIVF